MSFSIIISEKGGAERKEAFDKNEINVGRVAGNDLMLPKGNVSKHHARLLFRDGRFIVTDLKSTNGTYVNGRKIAQATIVREGDKIYIGDFVLRLDGGAAPTAEGRPEESIATLARDAPPRPVPNPPAVTLKAPTHPPGAPLPRPQNLSVGSVGPSGAYENEPDDSAPMQAAKPSAAPAAPAPQPRPLTMPLNQMSPPLMGARSSVPAPAPLGPPPGGPPPLAPPPLAAPAPAPPPLAAPAPAPPPLAAPAPAPPPPAPAPPPLAAPAPAPPPPAPAPPPLAAPPPQAPRTSAPPPPLPSDHRAASVPPPRYTAPPSRQPPAKESPAQAGRRLALVTLLDRIADAINLAELDEDPNVSDALDQQIETTAREQAQSMRDEGEAPEGIDLDALVRDAHRELTGLGPLGPLLEDEEVLELHCARYDQLFALRHDRLNLEPIAFTSELALKRVIGRLAAESGEPWAGETVVERRLARGVSLVAVAPPAAAGHVLTIRKRTRVESTLDELARAGALSKQMGAFLEACVVGRANVLVCGTAPTQIVAALASVVRPGARVCVVQDAEELHVPHAQVIGLSGVGSPESDDEVTRAAARLRADALVIAQLSGAVAAASIDAMANGHDGVIAGAQAPTLRQGLSRIVAQLVLQRPGVGLDAMRDVVGEVFDIALEVVTLSDGRLRVTRVAELGGSDAKGVVARDVFSFTADATGSDGSFSATGVVPRLAGELATRGAKLDANLFKRGSR
ncbi:MAG: ATPase, T2SS/T4P/T4SS family [Polyangiaceae bacterium]